MEQLIREMSEEMVQRIEKQRNWVKEHYDQGSRYKYDSIDGKLHLLQGIIENKYYGKNDTMELQSLGITFGDTLSQQLSLDWIEVEDEYGIDPALRYKNTSILIFPLTMISKRIENDEQVIIKELFDGISNKVNEMILKL